MASRVGLVAVVCLLLASGCAAFPPSTDGSATPTDGDGTNRSPADGYERTTVTFVDENGTELAAVQVRVADTLAKRYTGLSDTESLDDGEGMLFVHDSEGTHAYVMRKMDFPLDIVFVDASGTVTAVHHAPLPAGDGGLKRYRGRGKYVVEVPMGYTNETGIDVGDRMVVGDR
ncbi:DUF192 domain-containing protein [Salinirarus marinus]|uniref:DUF192 domain-containing protein n=1 Tax=Salinirarus marinus TaxID=3068310 RepID=UPI003C6C0848